MSPQDLERELRARDPHLRLRRARAEDHYRIERKVRVGSAGWIDPSRFTNWDDYETARSGHCLIMKVRPNELDSRIFYTLWEGDIQRQGGAEKVYQKIMATYQERLEKSRNEWNDYVETCARDAFRYINTVRTVPEGYPTSRDPWARGGMSINSGV